MNELNSVKRGTILLLHNIPLYVTVYKILSVNKIPSKWMSTLIPIYKNKRDIQNYTNYHGINLMSHTMKLQERVIEHRLRHKNIGESIWFYAKIIYHGSYFLP